jgi:hypothetical protein
MGTLERVWRARGVVIGLVGAIITGALLTACGDSAVSEKTAETSTTTTLAPRPAGVDPSISAKMICAAEAQKDLAKSLGITASPVTTPTWVDHVYSCRYVYPNASIGLSLKELDSAAQTTRYFDGLGLQLGRTESLAMGQGAFLTGTGSLVVRKDWKVLHIDVSQVPATFGQNALRHRETAISIAFALLGCWTGA